MAEYTVEGVVLRRWDAGEADRRVAVLTEQHGKIYLTAKGARKAGARLAGSTEPATHARFGVGARRNAYITQVQPLRGFATMRADYERLLCAMALLEAVDAIAPEGQPLPEVYAVCIEGLSAIAGANSAVCALCWSDLRLMRSAGFEPDFGEALRTNSTWLDPQEGGAARGHSTSAFEVHREVLIALARLQEAEAAPPNLKRAAAVAGAIHRFWLEYAHHPLHARRSLLTSLG